MRLRWSWFHNDIPPFHVPKMCLPHILGCPSKCHVAPLSFYHVWSSSHCQLQERKSCRAWMNAYAYCITCRREWLPPVVIGEQGSARCGWSRLVTVYGGCSCSKRTKSVGYQSTISWRMCTNSSYVCSMRLILEHGLALEHLVIVSASLNATKTFS